MRKYAKQFENLTALLQKEIFDIDRYIHGKKRMNSFSDLQNPRFKQIIVPLDDGLEKKSDSMKYKANILV